MVSSRIPQPVIDKVDAYATANGHTRSKAVALLVELGLKAAPSGKGKRP